MTSGKLWPVSTWTTGNGILQGQNAFSARRNITIESLPPEKSMPGCSNSAATSRMMWIDSASSSRRLDNSYAMVQKAYGRNSDLTSQHSIPAALDR